MLLFLLYLYLSFGFIVSLILCGLVAQQESVDIALPVKFSVCFLLGFVFWPAFVYMWWNE